MGCQGTVLASPADVKWVSRRRFGSSGSAALVLTMMIAGCQADATYVRLEIVRPSAVALDELQLEVGDLLRSMPVAERVTLLVPDDWSGTFVPVVVHGRHDGLVAATGTTEVAPIRGVTTNARVVLVDAACDQPCVLGKRECAGDGVVTCELSASGCPAWSAPAACTAATPYCSSGECRDRCEDECAIGATTCAGTDGQRGCGEADSDTCLDWLPETPCTDGSLCTGDACAIGASLAVRKAGTGSGVVASVPGGISCGSDCTELFALGAVVTLSVVPSAGSTFVGWSGGGCSGTTTCAVTMSAARELTATFEGPCGDDCAPNETACTSSTQQRRCGQADADACLEWLPATSCGTGELCTMDACAPGATLTVTTSGSGSVASVPTGIACGSDCTQLYATGTSVSLVATPSSGWMFGGWTGGGCSGTGACTIAMTASKQVTATFSPACAASCAIVTVTSSSTAQADALAIDDGHVYWTVSEEDTMVRRVAKSGGLSQDIASNADDLLGPARTLAVDATHVYWGMDDDEEGGYVYRMAKSGGALGVLDDPDETAQLALGPTQIYTTAASLGDPWWLSVEPKTGGPAVVVSMTPTSHGLATNASHVYWTEKVSVGSDTPIVRRAHGSSSTTTFHPSVEATDRLYADDTHVYWFSSRLRRKPVGGGTTQLLDDVPVNDVATNDRYVVWARGTADEIVIRDKTTNAEHTLSLPSEAKWIEIDDAYVYWTYAATTATAGVFKARLCACAP